MFYDQLVGICITLGTAFCLFNSIVEFDLQQTEVSKNPQWAYRSTDFNIDAQMMKSGGKKTNKSIHYILWTEQSIQKIAQTTLNLRLKSDISVLR